jgi:hypothetical protein
MIIELMSIEKYFEILIVVQTFSVVLLILFRLIALEHLRSYIFFLIALSSGVTAYFIYQLA